MLKIGEAARRLGVTGATLKAYEKTGDLLPAWKTPSGARYYSADDIDAFVRRPMGRPRLVGAANQPAAAE